MAITRALTLKVMLVVFAAMLLLASCAKSATTTIATTTVAPKPTTTTLKPLPSVINWPARSGAGTGDFAIGMADALTKKLGVKVGVQSVASELEQLKAMKANQGDITVFGVSTQWSAINGTGDFARPEWGPQALRVIFRGPPQYVILFTTKQSGIKTYADVKGKRVAYFPASQVQNDTIAAFLGAMGLTWDDVKKVNVDAQKVMFDGLAAGIIDVGGPVLFPASNLVELDATKGLYIIPFTPTAEGEKTFIQKYPYFALGNVAKGSILGAEQDMKLPLSINSVLCYDTRDEDMVYQITRAAYSIIEDVSIAQSQGWTKAGAAALPVLTPFHPGAVKFYKEIGLWGPENEKLQQSLLQAEQDRIAQWQKANPPAK